MTDTPAKLLRVLQRIGFRILREGRRHTLLARGDQLIAVPRHGANLPTGTFQAILRQAGISREDYLRLR